MFDQVRQDLRYAFRALNGSRPVTLLAIVILALALGATTAMFSLVEAVLFPRLPYAAPERLVALTQNVAALGDVRVGVAPNEYVAYRDRTRAFAALGGYSSREMDLTGDAEPQHLTVASMTSGTFEALGVAPVLGRPFTGSDEDHTAENVAILSDALWQQRYGRSPAALGTAVTLDEESYRVVGVMPAGFVFPKTPASSGDAPALWTILRFTPEQIADRASNFATLVVARLRDGVTVGAASDDVRRVASEFQSEDPTVYAGTIRVRPSLDRWGVENRQKMQSTVLVVAGAIGLLLVIACFTVANLLLAQASDRRREIALRSALGSPTARIARQLLVETLLLASAAGLAGCLVAYWCMRLAGRSWTSDVDLSGVSFDGTALACALGLSLLTGLACGLAPVVYSRPTGLEELLRQSRQHSSSARATRLRDAFVVAQAAIAVVLLIGAGLSMRSFLNVLNVPIGFTPDRAVVLQTAFNPQRYKDAHRRRTALRQIVENVGALPGVTAVGVTTHLPLATTRKVGFSIEGQPQDTIHRAENALVSAGYFRAMEIPLVTGRTFLDREAGPLEAVVNASFARQYWPDSDPLGRVLAWSGRRLTIVGVVGDVHITGLDAAADLTIYTNIYQISSAAAASATLVARTTGRETLTVPAIRQAIWSVDSALPIFRIRDLQEVVAGSLATRRALMWLLAAFGVLALILAVAGVYGLLSYAARLRRLDVAIRMALGAQRTEVVTLLLSRGVWLTVAGEAVGLALAGVLVSGATRLLVGVEPHDPATFAIAAAVVFTTCIMASALPAWRAGGTNPAQVLRAGQ